MSFTPVISRKRIFKKNWCEFRWVLPLLFLVGYLSTYPRLEGFEIEYLGLTFISIFACCLLLTRLNPPLQKKLPIWIIFAVFMVAYYFKFYLLICNPEILRDGWVERNLYFLVQSPTVIFETFATISYAFIVFCITAWFLLGNARSLQMETLKRRINYRSAISILQWFIPILMGVTTYVMYITGICRMGADNPKLPFHLAGWIFYIQSTLIPSLLLLLIWSSDKTGLRKHFNFGVILLFMHGVSAMLLRSSRGAILSSFIALIVLFLVTDRVTKKRVQLFGIVFLITIILFPVISSYRYMRAADLSGSIVPLFVESVINISSVESFSFFKMINDVIVSIVFRFTGADSLFHIIGANLSPLYTDAFNVSVTRFFTVDVIGFPPEAIHGSAPSFLGWVYIVGGNGLVMISIFGFTVFAWMFWRILPKLKLRCMPVAQALFLMWIFSSFSEGVLDRLYLKVLVMAGSIAACEWLIRISRSGTVFKNIEVSKSREYAGVE
ncbi:MAG: hypothetical protein KAI50_11200 [Desulfobacterales bacterium]|nr:hypothetical protein [Desulfobacterales bacterium]